MKSVKSKGVRVGTQSSKIKIQRGQNQQSGQKQQRNSKPQQKVHALDRALDVKDKKIGKQQKQGHGSQQKQRIRAPPPFPMPPPELMMPPFGMLPGGGGAGGRGGRGGGGFAPLTVQMSDRLAGQNLAHQRGSRGMGPGPSKPRPNPDGPGKWLHDLHNPTDMGPPKFGRPDGPPSVPNSRLKISNLHYNVTPQDLKELFGSIGLLKAWDIDSDTSGRSTGTGMVEYYDAADADKAMFQLNGATLDGMKLKIEIDDGLEPPRKLKSGIKVEYGGESAQVPRGPARLLTQAMQQRQGAGGRGQGAHARGMGVPKSLVNRIGGAGRMAASDAMQE